MIPKEQRKTIGELQHEYLSNLLDCQRDAIEKAISENKINNVVMTLKQAENRVVLLNQYTAWLYINLKV